MSTAALWDELSDWDEDLFGDAGGFPFGGGSGPGGVPIFTPVFTGAYVMVEVAFGADLTSDPGGWNWFDVTGDVRYDSAVSITQGRSDETSQAQPASCSFRLDNSTGNYTPFTPASIYYPNVRRNTPVRVRLDPGDGLGFRTRFQGYAAGFTPGWDPSAQLATVAVSAAGVLRRLTQGKTPLRSALVRAMLDPAPIAAWPLDDESSATSAANIAGGTVLAPTPGVVFGADPGTLAGTSTCVQMPIGGQLTGFTPSYTTTGFLAVSLWIKAYATVNATVLTFLTGTFAAGGFARIEFNAFNAAFPPSAFNVRLYDTSGVSVEVDSGTGSPGLAVDPFDRAWHQVFFTAVTSGSNTIMTLYVDGILAASTTYVGATAGRLERVTLQNVAASDTGTVSVAGLTIITDSTATSTYDAGTGYTGETADTRLSRLCAEQGEQITITGSSNITMGAQTQATFVDLLRQCEAADGGLLYDGFSPGLAYVCRSSRYNETATLTLDMAADPPQVANPFAPVDDDQRNRNDWTVSRTGGSSARYVDQTGPLGVDAIGTYDSSIDLNLADDTGLLDQAGWRVHLGTFEGLRYPTLTIDLLAVPNLATEWLAVMLTGRVNVVNVTSRALQHPPDDLSLGVEGWSETLGLFTWAVTQNCSPQTPWRVGVLEDATNPLRLDTDGSQLAAAASTTDTSWQVATTSGPLWTTTATFPADFPFDVGIEGERVTVTDISGTSSPQTFTVTRSVNGVVAGHNPGAAMSLWQPPVLAL